MENKKEICEALVPVLQMTDAFKDLTGLMYNEDDKNHFGDETVTPVYRNDRYAGYLDAATNEPVKEWCGPSINVTADSGISLLYDVIKALFREV